MWTRSTYPNDLKVTKSRSQKSHIEPPPLICRPSTADPISLDMLVIFLTTLTSLVTLNLYSRSTKFPLPHVLTLDRTFPLNVNLKKSICLCSCIQSFWWPWPWKSTSNLTFLYTLYKSLWCIHLSINNTIINEIIISNKCDKIILDLKWTFI